MMTKNIAVEIQKTGEKAGGLEKYKAFVNGKVVTNGIFRNETVAGKNAANQRAKTAYKKRMRYILFKEKNIDVPLGSDIDTFEKVYKSCFPKAQIGMVL